MSTQKKSNNFRNADKPTVLPISGKQTGQIPSWLEGNLFRTGPGLQTIGQDTYNHFFDGLAVLHRFEIKDGKASYQSRYLESDSYKKNMKAQRIVVSEFGTHRYPDPCKSLLGRFMSHFQSIDTTDNCNVNVAFYGDQLYAMTETEFVRRVDPKNLDTLGEKVKLTDYLTINHATAHPHTLPDGSMLNMGNNYRHKKGPHYCIVQVPPTYESDETCFKSARIIAEIPCRWRMYPCYYHSFSITTDKIVFVEQPYCLSVSKILTSDIRGACYRECLSWHPNQKTRIHVISFTTGEVHPIIYETVELFMFHQVNAYEEDGHIVLDLAAYNSAEFVSKSVQDVMRDSEHVQQNYIEGASLRRYVLPLEVPKNAPLGTNIVTLADARATAKLRTRSRMETIIDLGPDHLAPWMEFPRINYKYNGQKYRYVFGVGASDKRKQESVIPEADTLIKYDLETREQLTWERPDVLAGEPVFVPNPNGASPAEDDGVLLSPVLHVDDDKKVTLLVLDAKTMKELASVEFTTDGPVPGTFHGQWAQDGAKVHAL